MELIANKRLTEQELKEMAYDAISKLEMGEQYNKSVVASFKADAVNDIEVRKFGLELYRTNLVVPFDVALHMARIFSVKGYYVWRWQTYCNAVWYVVTNRNLRPEDKYQPFDH